MAKYLTLIITIVVMVVFNSCDKNDLNEAFTMLELNSTINAIAIDNNDTKWIATDEGLYYSIGIEFYLYPATTPEKVNSLYYDKKEDLLWISTESTLFNINTTINDFDEQKINTDDFRNSKVISMLIDENAKHWFGTEQGFSMLSESKWKNHDFRINAQGKYFEMMIEEFPINSIASYEGDYFFATSGAKLFRAFDYNDEVDAFTGATQWDPPYNGICISDTMHVVFVDSEGRQWMGGNLGIQVHIGHDPKGAGSFVYFVDELPDLHVYCINEAPNGNIWVGTGKGIAIFDGSNWNTITDELPDLTITAINFDNDGNTWIGTLKGLSKLSY